VETDAQYRDFLHLSDSFPHPPRVA
jgi:hypothetical protein